MKWYTEGNNGAIPNCTNLSVGIVAWFGDIGVSAIFSKADMVLTFQL